MPESESQDALIRELKKAGSDALGLNWRWLLRHSELRNTSAIEAFWVSAGYTSCGGNERRVDGYDAIASSLPVL